ncbi:MAG: STAS domain-containing protein [Spirochaetes bacterium]|nr:STAS domain-containing protein [Spirochaetota bacterium]
MKIDIKKRDTIALIQITGKINIETVLRLDEVINKFMNDPAITAIALNCRKLEHVDSSGLGSWIQYINTAKSLNKEFFLYDLPSNILSIIEMAFLMNFLKCTTSEKLNEEFKTDFFKISD